MLSPALVRVSIVSENKIWRLKKRSQPKQPVRKNKERIFPGD